MKNKYVLILLWSFIISCNQIEKEKHLLPAGYTGSVIIFFDWPNGAKIKYDSNGYRNYFIPNNGILKSKFTSNRGTILNDNDRLFYYQKGGDLEKIEWDIEGKKLNFGSDSNKIFVVTTGVGALSMKNKEALYQLYFVDSLKNLNNYNFSAGLIEEAFLKE